MLQIVPYDTWHIGMLDLTPELAVFRRDMITQDEVEALKTGGMTWTGMENDRVVGCAGFLPVWQGRVQAWAIFGKMTKRYWPQVVRKIQSEMAVLKSKGVRRVEATVATNFGQGCRLAFLLGFKVEGEMKSYAPDGSNHFLYAKVL